MIITCVTFQKYIKLKKFHKLKRFLICILKVINKLHLFEIIQTHFCFQECITSSADILTLLLFKPADSIFKFSLPESNIV